MDVYLAQLQLQIAGLAENDPQNLRSAQCAVGGAGGLDSGTRP